MHHINQICLYYSENGISFRY